MKGLINDSLIFALILFSYTWAHNPPRLRRFYSIFAAGSSSSRGSDVMTLLLVQFCVKWVFKRK